MRDSDPRPMPTELQGAYRNPTDLLGVLYAWTLPQRRQVMSDLLSLLVRNLGMVEFPHGRKQTRTLEQRVKAYENPLSAINLMISVEQYGGREVTLPYLASVMEPMWQDRWKGMSWGYPIDVDHFGRLSRHVFGQKQLAWISAQHCRAATSHMDNQRALNKCLEMIDLVERWSLGQRNADEVEAASRTIAGVLDGLMTIYSNISSQYVLHGVWYASAITQFDRSDEGKTGSMVASCINSCVLAERYSPNDQERYRSSLIQATEPFKEACERTKKMIEPTLMTRSYAYV